MKNTQYVQTNTFFVITQNLKIITSLLFGVGADQPVELKTVPRKIMQKNHVK